MDSAGSVTELARDGSGAEKALAVAAYLRRLSSVLDDAPVLLDELDLVPTHDVATVTALVSALTRTFTGLRVALLDEAAERGVPRDAGFADTRSWLADCDPLLPQPDLGAIDRCHDETSRPTLSQLRAAVVDGSVGPSDAIQAAKVVDHLASVVAPSSGVAPDGTELTPDQVAERHQCLVADAITLCTTGPRAG